uniref:WGS project CBMI000000000 data, contig CS3069_c002807 n=1 Tax=Fusarium clavum TaxID=2594811 RepID=A0A090MD32_9HYPO|nr:unnamed protein product [Fusarium clavum]
MTDEVKVAIAYSTAGLAVSCVASSFVDEEERPDTITDTFNEPTERSMIKQYPAMTITANKLMGDA